MNLTTPPTEIEISEALHIVSLLGNEFPVQIIRKLTFERDKYKAALKEISNHSVCCDARYTADNALSTF